MSLNYGDCEQMVAHMKSLEARTREMEAALSVAREALVFVCENLGGAWVHQRGVMGHTEPSCDCGAQGWVKPTHDLAEKTLSHPAIQKEAERIRAMEEVVEAARSFADYVEPFAAPTGVSLKGALQRLDEREG